MKKKKSLISYLFENHDLIKETKIKQKKSIKEIMYVNYKSTLKANCNIETYI